ncbi:MAG: hypothetical protein WBD05_01820 [Phycisphaerae bacterium]
MRVTKWLILTVLAVSAALAGCGHRQTRRDVYLNLMTTRQRAKYLLLEAEYKPVSLRLAYLQKIGLYQTWTKQPKEIQEAALHRRVVEDMIPLQVQMAWGPPDRRRDASLPEEAATGRTRMVWDYAFSDKEGHGNNGYERSVCFLDGHVLWVRGP